MDSEGRPTDVTDHSSNHAALQQMYELETIRWRGGENHHKGPHDNFCFVCGGERELFGCETCENCYHASCMSPGLYPNEVPSFWFCPHCVNHELHIPPGSPTSYFTPVTVPGHLTTQSSYFSPFPIASQVTPQETHVAAERDGASAAAVHTPLLHPAETGGHKRQNSIPTQLQRATRIPEVTSSRNAPTSTETTAITTSHTFRPLESHQLQLQLKRSSRHHKRSKTPPPPQPQSQPSQPRKKSKYSAFSADVDKALAVIRNELETAAAHGKSADHLRDEVDSLRQQLKLQDGQLALTRRELEIVKRDLKGERERERERERARSDQASVREEVRSQREEIGKLRELVARKDEELRDWKGRLRAMIGGGLE